MPLSLEEEEDVMCAIGKVLSSLTNVADLNAALERLLKPSHDAIEALVRFPFLCYDAIYVHCVCTSTDMCCVITRVLVIVCRL